LTALSDRSPRRNPIPQAPLWLGLAGLIPFYAAAFLMLTADAGIANLGHLAFVIYAAAILSFLGGVRFGLELAHSPDNPRPLTLVYAVLPAIAGWALALFSVTTDALHGVASAFAGLFAAQYVWDRTSANDGSAPKWYPLLRQVLTGGVMLACLALPIAGLIGRT
jgi:uncharacterized membrane protein HdeD (DUF308 family)